MLNLRLVFLATDPAAMDPDRSAAALLIRRRCIGLSAGAATALCLCFILPEPQRFMGLLAVPLWIRLLTARLRPTAAAFRDETLTP
jgi:hypothetical protein